MAAANKDNLSKAQKDFIDYRFNEVFKRLDKIDGRMDSFTFAKQGSLDEAVAEVNKLTGRVTIMEQKIKPIEKIYYLVLGLMVTGIGGFFLFLLERSISK